MGQRVISLGGLRRQQRVLKAIRIRFPDLSSIWAGGLNYLAYLLRLPVSYRTSKISIESCSLCNMKCPHCFVHRTGATDGMEHARAIMSDETFAAIMTQLKPGLVDWLCFNCWGEPMMHPKLPAMLAQARDRGFKTMFYTNGLLLDAARTRQLIDAGLRRLVVSMDGTGEVYESIRATPYAGLKERLLTVLRVRDECKSRLSVELSCIVNDRTLPAIPALLAEWDEVVDNVQFITEMVTDGKRCDRCIHLWMGHISIFADGQVNVCGFDYDGELNLGNIRDINLATLWNGERLRALRRQHARGQMTGVCSRCQTQNLTDVPSSQ